jgi:gamma-F420-2:alpha-L-glutamate ligase
MLVAVPQGTRADVPEAPEVLRFSAGRARGRHRAQRAATAGVDLIVDSPAMAGPPSIAGASSEARPDHRAHRSETSYFMLAVLRHFRAPGCRHGQRSRGAIEAVADKLQTLQMLSGAGLPIPKTILGKFPVDVDIVERELKFPVVVKTLRGTRGNGVLLCANREQFNDLASLLDGARTLCRLHIPAVHCQIVMAVMSACWSLDGKVIAAMEPARSRRRVQVETSRPVDRVSHLPRA